MKPNQLAVSILVAVTALVVVGVLLKTQAKAAIGAVADINTGTPFEDTGIVGTVGNITDVASAGLLSRFGSFLGEKISGVTDTRTLDELTNTQPAGIAAPTTL